jgi:hypothetical protein
VSSLMGQVFPLKALLVVQLNCRWRVAHPNVFGLSTQRGMGGSPACTRIWVRGIPRLKIETWGTRFLCWVESARGSRRFFVADGFGSSG